MLRSPAENSDVASREILPSLGRRCCRFEIINSVIVSESGVEKRHHSFEGIQFTTPSDENNDVVMVK